LVVPPTDAYLESLLAKQHIVALVAQASEDVVGGLVASELDKFERARREFYIYDLAVVPEHRRYGIVTALI
jgi:aminoglycoside 3-N-acetyltransferase I